MPDRDVQLKSRLASVASGVITGSLVSVVVQPFDVIRTRMQADAASQALRATISTAINIVKQEGTRGLWRGTGPTIWRLSLGLGIQFATLEGLKDALLSRGQYSADQRSRKSALQLNSWEAFLAGGAARTVAAIVTCPITVVKTQMEYAGHGVKHKGTFDALITIAKKEQLPGLYRGLGPTILSNAPFSALYYMFYTNLRAKLAQDSTPTATTNFCSGAMASVAATLLTQPADIIRTHMQLGLGRGASRMGPLQTLQAIWQLGPSAVFAGATPRVLKRSIQAALVWTIYEELQPRLKELGQQKA